MSRSEQDAGKMDKIHIGTHTAPPPAIQPEDVENEVVAVCPPQLIRAHSRLVYGRDDPICAFVDYVIVPILTNTGADIIYLRGPDFAAIADRLLHLYNLKEGGKRPGDDVARLLGVMGSRFADDEDTKPSFEGAALANHPASKLIATMIDENEAAARKKITNGLPSHMQ